MAVWAASTNINPQLRQSQLRFFSDFQRVDLLVGSRSDKHAMASFSVRKPGADAWSTRWGESNLGGLTAAAEHRIKLAGSEKFAEKMST